MRKPFHSARLCALIALSTAAMSLYAQNIETEPVNNNDTELDSLFRSLPEVVVSGTQPIATLRDGRLNYNMQLLQEKLPAASAFDAISNIPGMIVGSDDDVKFANQSVTLILNGKPTSMSQTQLITLLKSMPAERLQRAELMLAAPPSLHVRGAALNLVTTKSADKQSTSGQVQAGAIWNKYMRGTVAANVIHQTGRWTIDANYSGRAGKSYGEVEHTAQHLLNGERVPYSEITKGSTKAIYNNVRLGVDYQIGKGHSMGLAYTGDFTDYESLNRSHGTYLSRQFRDGTTTMHNIDWNYQLPFGLRLTASYTHYKSPFDQTLTVNPTEESVSVAVESLNKNSSSHQTIGVWKLSADQTHQLSQKWSLNYGLSGYFSSNKSSQQTFDITGQPIALGTSSVDINEQIVDFYAGFGFNPTQTLSLTANIEAERYHSPLFSEWRMYPSMNLTWMASKNHVLNLSVASNATYPSYWSIMSGVNYSSAYSEVWGNPSLKPSSNYEFNLMWQFCQRYTIVAYANLNQNSMIQLPYQPQDRMAVVMQTVNFDHRNSFGLQAMAQLQVGSWLSGNAFVGVQRHNDKLSNFFDISLDRWKTVLLVGGNFSFIPSKKAGLTFTLRPFFQSKAIQGVYNILPIFKLTPSIQWASKDKRWTLLLHAKNPINRRVRTVDTYQGQNYRMNVLQDYREVTLTLTYKFGNYRQRKHQQVDTSRMGH